MYSTAIDSCINHCKSYTYRYVQTLNFIQWSLIRITILTQGKKSLKRFLCLIFEAVHTTGRPTLYLMMCTITCSLNISKDKNLIFGFRIWLRWNRNRFAWLILILVYVSGIRNDKTIYIVLESLKGVGTSWNKKSITGKSFFSHSIKFSSSLVELKAFCFSWRGANKEPLRTV